jgi:hypothetical protein
MKIMISKTTNLWAKYAMAEFMTIENRIGKLRKSIRTTVKCFD